MGDHRGAAPPGSRLYRLLLRLLPAEFDALDRREMAATFAARVRRARATGGALAASGTRLRETVDLVATVLRSRTARLADDVRQDFRTGLRSLVRSPVASALAVLCLALGIGATTAIFSALDVWLIRPLALPNADRLVAVHMANRAEGRWGNVFSVRDWVDWRRESTSVDLAVYRPDGANLASDERTERIRVLRASVNLPAVLGFTPRDGRLFTEDEGRSDAPRVVLLTDAFWRSRFGADPGIVGRDVVLDGLPHAVVGVLRPGDALPGQRADAWLPLRVSGEEARGGHSLDGIGLLRPGVTLAAAAEELDAVAARVAEQDPLRTFPDALVRPLRKAVYGPEFEQGGVLLAVAVLGVLLIACADIANLLLARGLSRGREMAVRASLGAGRSRMVRQLLTENAILAAAGGAAGLAVGFLGVEFLLHFVLPPEEVPGWSEIALDGRAVAFAGALTLGSLFLFGLPPSLRASRVDLRESLAEAERGSPGGRGHRLAAGLVVAQIASAVTLSVVCGLLIRDALELRGRDLGLRTEDALVFRVATPRVDRGGSEEEVHAFHDRLAERLADAPGVEAVARSTGPPARGWSTGLYAIPGSAAGSEEARRSAESRRVSAEYAAVMGLEMVAGRWFDPDLDRPGAPAAAVVSLALAERWWPRPADALGRVVDHGRPLTIVGVVDAGRMRGPSREPPDVIFQSLDQAPTSLPFYVVATDDEAPGLPATVRSLVREADPDAAVFGLEPIERQVAGTYGSSTAALRIFGALGLLALVLTVVGVYGVTAHAVGRRRREVGLRLALGADPGSVVRMVLLRSAKLAGVGLALGTVLALVAGRGLAFLVFGISPRDPLALGVAAGAVLVSVGVASWVPAAAAARVDPAGTLRGE